MIRDELEFFGGDPGEALRADVPFEVIGRFPRPRGGKVVTVYERRSGP